MLACGRPMPAPASGEDRRKDGLHGPQASSAGSRGESRVRCIWNPVPRGKPLHNHARSVTKHRTQGPRGAPHRSLRLCPLRQDTGSGGQWLTSWGPCRYLGEGPRLGRVLCTPFPRPARTPARAGVFGAPHAHPSPRCSRAAWAKPAFSGLVGGQSPRPWQADSGTSTSRGPSCRSEAGRCVGPWEASLVPSASAAAWP